MGCARCIKTVTGIFQQEGLEIKNVRLGIIELYKEPEAELLNKIRNKLASEGFEMLDDQRVRLIYCGEAMGRMGLYVRFY